MALTPKKKPNISTSNEISKKRTVSMARKRVRDGGCKEKAESKTGGTSLKRSLKSETDNLFSGGSVKRKSNVELNKTKNSNKVDHNLGKESVAMEGTSVHNMNVQQLLALGEQSHVKLSNLDNDEFGEVSSDSDSDFEEVKNTNDNEPVIPKDGVDITLEVPNLSYRQKKKGFNWQDHLKRQINRVRKDLQLLMHKVHVLCWIAHLRYVNNVLNNPILMKSCASFVKSKNLYPSKYSDLSYLEGILKWFHKNFVLKKNTVDPLCTGGLLEEIDYQFKNKLAFTCKAYIFMFIILLRVLGLKARIVMSFQVLPIRPSLLQSDESKSKNEELKKSKAEKLKVDKNINVESVMQESVEPTCSRKSKRKSSENSVEQKGKKKKIKEVEVQNQTEISDNESESEHFKPSPKNLKKKIKLNPKATDVESTQKVKGRKHTNDTTNLTEKNLNIKEEDEGFTQKSLIKKNTKNTTKRKEETAEKENVKVKEGADVWIEVYLEAEEKWLSVDVPRQKIHCIGEIYSRATHPITYIIVCNNDGTLKDVTKRYVPSWHSDTRKRRVDEIWWGETMKNFLPPKTPQDKEEDEDINRQILDQPLPSSISEFKDHPLYALKRHLLKFEAIYPPDAPTLGFVRGEPVYARECVSTLHSREMWYKQARLVRLKEEPYKIVKARPKYDKMTGEIKKDLPLELFGKWQTEDYIPPVATGGKVPRNEYGNVDLFKPCMLPIGTVHLQIPALNRIAKKLDIDCAPATVGFDFHSGGSHPVFDGFVVCEEFKETLLDAWNKEIDESSKKEEEKKNKRVYGNWKRLIRGLLIREKLKVKYAFGENSDEKDQSTLGPKASTSQ